MKLERKESCVVAMKAAWMCVVILELIHEGEGPCRAGPLPREVDFVVTSAWKKVVI